MGSRVQNKNKRIDSFDIVIRINELGISEDLFEDYGSKTDIVFNRECIYYVKVCYNTIYFNKKRILVNQIIFL